MQVFAQGLPLDARVGKLASLRTTRYPQHVGQPQCHADKRPSGGSPYHHPLYIEPHRPNTPHRRVVRPCGILSGRDHSAALAARVVLVRRRPLVEINAAAKRASP